MKKYYTKTVKGVRCIRCRDYYPTCRELVRHYASDGTCRLVLSLGRTTA